MAEVNEKVDAMAIDLRTNIAEHGELLLVRNIAKDHPWYLVLLFSLNSITFLSNIPSFVPANSTSSRLKLFTLPQFVWLGFCNQCNSACFPWSRNIGHFSLNLIYAVSTHNNVGFTWLKIYIFSLILFQASLMSTSSSSSSSSSKFSKAVNLFENWNLLLSQYRIKELKEMKGFKQRRDSNL